MGGCFIVRGVVSAWLVSEGGDNQPTVDSRKTQRPVLFISYSRKDRAFLERLWIHLRPLEVHYRLQRWDDSRIEPGDIWMDEIQKALEIASVALLLVSPDFLASEFINREELPPLFEAAKEKGLKVLWVPLVPCSLKRFPQITKYQSVLPINQTLAEMSVTERERAYATIADIIDDLFDHLEGGSSLRRHEEHVKLSNLGGQGDQSDMQQSMEEGDLYGKRQNFNDDSFTCLQRDSLEEGDVILENNETAITTMKKDLLEKIYRRLHAPGRDSGQVRILEGN
jgi:hypothetical protein